MDKLSEIKKALEAATPGPWKVFRDKSKGETLIGTSWDHPQLKGPDSIVGHVYSVSGEYVYIRDYDADLIANAPEWLFYLLEQLEHARGCAEEAWKKEDAYEELAISIQQQLDAAKQEIASHGPEGRNYTNAQYVELLQEHELVKQHLKMAVEALGWYANGEIYSNVLGIRVLGDAGRRARQALSLIQEESIRPPANA